MRKPTRVTAMVLIALGMLPALAFANGNEQNQGSQVKTTVAGAAFKHDSKMSFSSMKNFKGMHQGHMQGENGTVSAVSTAGFNLTDSKGVVWTINTASTTIVTAFGQTISLANITVGSHANVRGSLSGNTITASRVVISPANTNPASGKGTVTAINGSSFTLQINNHGIPSTATVNTSASTTVMQNGATTTVSAITVGSKISVKGLWDQILNVLNAIKIRIF